MRKTETTVTGVSAPLTVTETIMLLIPTRATWRRMCLYHAREPVLLPVWQMTSLGQGFVGANETWRMMKRLCIQVRSPLHQWRRKHWGKGPRLSPSSLTLLSRALKTILHRLLQTQRMKVGNLAEVRLHAVFWILLCGSRLNSTGLASLGTSIVSHFHFYRLAGIRRRQHRRFPHIRWVIFTKSLGHLWPTCMVICTYAFRHYTAMHHHWSTQKSCWWNASAVNYIIHAFEGKWCLCLL